VVGDGPALEFLSQKFGAGLGAVGDDDFRDAGSPEVTRGRFRHFPGADQQYAVACERSENFASQFDGGVADGYGALSNLGSGANALGDVEGAGANQLKESADGSALLGE